ncbi:conserved hypothetical protein [Paraburkholderia piptadeniae]|uniref:Uncharacterized protein n=2 Tax=Paraburkholderia piptadeniae TaxID=1701573 RepID=A0A1N7RTA3_9BURK|nr:conserved hypothetical protein [Paraburkholderia piptadeniae]
MAMKILRYSVDGSSYYGILGIDGNVERLKCSPLEQLIPAGYVDHLESARILSPFHRPRIFGLGYNYRAHSQEVGKSTPTLPVLFMKPSTTVIGHEDAIIYPSDGENIHFEGELTVIIGKEARHVSEGDALDYVFGYTCGNDVSDRVLQRRESEFGCLLVGKGYDTFAPIGPVVETDLDPANLRLVTRVNGEVRQNGNTADLVYGVSALIAYLSKYMTLLPGDHIMTGTPAGVGPIKPGDTIEVEIEGIGVLRNRVLAAAEAMG